MSETPDNEILVEKERYIASALNECFARRLVSRPDPDGFNRVLPTPEVVKMSHDELWVWMLRVSGILTDATPQLRLVMHGLESGRGEEERMLKLELQVSGEDVGHVCLRPLPGEQAMWCMFYEFRKEPLAPQLGALCRLIRPWRVGSIGRQAIKDQLSRRGWDDEGFIITYQSVTAVDWEGEGARPDTHGHPQYGALRPSGRKRGTFGDASVLGWATIRADPGFDSVLTFEELVALPGYAQALDAYWLEHYEDQEIPDKQAIKAAKPAYKQAFRKLMFRQWDFYQNSLGRIGMKSD